MSEGVANSCALTYTNTYIRNGGIHMAEVIMRNTKRAAIKAFLSSQMEFIVYGIKLRFEHAYGPYYQCLLPDGGEVFRLKQTSSGVAVMDV